MSDDVYGQLADALDKLPNGFPRTDSGIELEVLKRIFTLEEARIASILGREMESYEDISTRVGLELETAKETLSEMAQKNLLWSTDIDGTPHYRLAPWIVGIYEAQNKRMDHEFAHLVEEYFLEGGMEGLMQPLPSIHRVVPAQSAVKSEWILPYDDVKAIINSSKVFHESQCICRKQQDHIGRKCDFPSGLCLSFSSRERPPRPGDISKEEALAVLDKAEEIGLVHTVSNVMEGLTYVCNCCGCCCAILRGVTEFGVENSVAQANYYGVIIEGECIGCGACETRCHVNAVSIVDGLAIIEKERCIGCGLCVTGCPTGAAGLVLKPEDERMDPPADFSTWENERLRNRGLA
ncbi:4Fe-4S binding protein [Candidatus Bathyarchaeota archaeon]|nr:4Fe-4S binding protein [Candidatus Bathyarchaeota archaeon]